MACEQKKLYADEPQMVQFAPKMLQLAAYNPIAYKKLRETFAK
jgi:hypothetical protein